MTETEIKANAYDDLVDLIESLPESEMSNNIFTYAQIFELIRNTKIKIVESEGWCDRNL